MLVHRQTSVLRAVGAVAGFGASYLVTATPVGARIAANSSASVATVDSGHSFVAGDKALIYQSGAAGILTTAVTSVTATTITFTSGSYSLATGDRLVNLGPDTGTTQANYDASPMALYSDPDGGTSVTNATLTCNSLGEWEYWHRGDGTFWELVRTSAGIPVNVIEGHGGVPGRVNIVDFGASPAASNNSTRIQAAMDVIVGRGGNADLVGPKDASFTITSGVTFGTASANSLRNCVIRDLRLSCSGITAITLREAQDVRIVDVDIDGNESASSIGIYVRNCNYVWIDRCTIRDCQKAIQLASDTGTNQNTIIVCNNHFYIGQLSTDTTGIASSIGIDIDTADNLIYDNRMYGFVTGIDVDATSQMIRGNHIFKGYPSTNVMQYCLDVTSNNATILGNYLDNATVHQIRLTDPFTEHIIGNYFLFGSTNLVPGISFEYSSNSAFSQIVITGNHFRYSATYSDEVIDLGASTQYSHADTAGVDIDNNTFQGYNGTSPIQGNNGADDLGETFICPQTTASVRVISGATPNVKGATIVTTNNSSSTTVTALGGGLPGARLTILLGDGNTTFQHSSSLKLKGGGDWSPSSADSIVFAHDGSNWREVARTAQAAITSEIVTNVSVTGNDAIVTFGRFVINLTNTSGTNTVTLNAPSASDDGRIIICHISAITAGSLALADSGTCALSAAWTPDAGDTLTLMAKATVWKELARSAN